MNIIMSKSEQGTCERRKQHHNNNNSNNKNNNWSKTRLERVSIVLKASLRLCGKV